MADKRDSLQPHIDAFPLRMAGARKAALKIQEMLCITDNDTDKVADVIATYFAGWIPAKQGRDSSVVTRAQQYQKDFIDGTFDDRQDNA